MSIFSSGSHYLSTKGMSLRHLVLMGSFNLAVVVLIAVSASMVSVLPLRLLIAAVLGACFAVLQMIWLRNLVTGYVQKINKGAVTARRFQNISRYFESILQDSTDIIFSVDNEGYLLKFNTGSQSHFGYTQEEIVGKPLKTLFVNEVDERRILETVLLNGKSTNEETPMKRKDGQIILVNLSMSEMKNDNNQIIGLVVTAKDITEKKKLENELVKKNELLGKLAITDSLTELYNSRHFFDQIKREISRFNRTPEHKLAVIMIDVDHFKELNDTQGHQMGDQVLRSLGEIIRACIRRDVDSGYRYGGDEFIVILPDTDKNKARYAAERIHKQFAALTFGKTSLSIGITEAMGHEDEKVLLHRADEALYTSKREGRDRITVA